MHDVHSQKNKDDSKKWLFIREQFQIKLYKVENTYYYRATKLRLLPKI